MDLSNSSIIVMNMGLNNIDNGKIYGNAIKKRKIDRNTKVSLFNSILGCSNLDEFVTNDNNKNSSNNAPTITTVRHEYKKELDKYLKDAICEAININKYNDNPMHDIFYGKTRILSRIV